MKKIYIEITNNCNLNCSFCIKNSRPSKFISKQDFESILEKVKPYTKYLYFHVLGEPLLHPYFNELVDIASKDFYINITTNGYLINRLNTKNIRQLNISLHSYSPLYKISIEEYMSNIFNVVDKLDNTYISYRFWANNEYSSNMLNLLNKHYNTNFIIGSLNRCNKLKDNVFINTFKEFEWPSLNREALYTSGTCYALRDHVAILSDGTVVPCCLDTKGDIKLGNIFDKNIHDILNSEKVLNMLDGFKNNKKVEELCKRCNFIDND